MERQRLIELLFAAAAVSFLVVGCFLVLRPFLSALMWAVILCYASWPFYRWLVRKLGGRRSLTAILMIQMSVWRDGRISGVPAVANAAGRSCPRSGPATIS